MTRIPASTSTFARSPTSSGVAEAERFEQERDATRRRFRLATERLGLVPPIMSWRVGGYVEEMTVQPKVTEVFGSGTPSRCGPASSGTPAHTVVRGSGELPGLVS